MRRLIVVGSLVLAFAAAPQPAAAWGLDVHKFIVARAIPLLPIEIRPFFEKYQVEVVEHSVDPDLWRTAGWLEEPPRHFLDMDAYGPHPFTALPRVQDAAIRKYGAAFVEKNGTLPWRAEEIHGKLVEAFTQKTGYSRSNIRFFSSVLAHYAADAHVPFHAALNYDGQLTGQWGIHARFETELFERYQSRLTIAPRPVASVAGTRDMIFDTLVAGFPLTQPLLDADRAAVQGRTAYDDQYFTLFFGKAQPILERRLSEAITGVASLVTSAWIDAGRPAVPVQEVRTPRPVRRPQ